MDNIWYHVAVPIGSAIIGGATMFGVFKQKIKTMEQTEELQSMQIQNLQQTKVDHDECQRCRQETCNRIQEVKVAVKGLEKETKVSGEQIRRELISNKESVLEKFTAIATTLGAVQQYMKEHGT